jgi:hypothetical protein
MAIAFNFIYSGRVIDADTIARNDFRTTGSSPAMNASHGVPNGM